MLLLLAVNISVERRRREERSKSRSRRAGLRTAVVSERVLPSSIPAHTTITAPRWSLMRVLSRLQVSLNNVPNINPTVGAVSSFLCLASVLIRQTVFAICLCIWLNSVTNQFLFFYAGGEKNVRICKSSSRNCGRGK